MKKLFFIFMTLTLANFAQANDEVTISLDHSDMYYLYPICNEVLIEAQERRDELSELGIHIDASFFRSRIGPGGTTITKDAKCVVRVITTNINTNLKAKNLVFNGFKSRDEANNKCESFIESLKQDSPSKYITSLKKVVKMGYFRKSYDCEVTYVIAD
jgi:hypothetical protein